MIVAAALLVLLELPAPAAKTAPPATSVDSGGLTRAEIQRPISVVMPQIKSCYEKQLAKEPALTGTLTTSWIIVADGSVSEAKVATATFHGEQGQLVADCVIDIISRLKFPMPKGGGKVFVTYPFVFSSSDPPANTASSSTPSSSPFGCGALFAR